MTGTEDVVFVYSKDEGVLGIGTSARSDLGYSRVCVPDILCPYEEYTGNVTLSLTNATTGEVTWKDWVIRTPKLLQNVVDMFQSGLASQMPTICGFFDIEFRQMGDRREYYYAGNDSILSGAYSPIASVLLDDDFELFEGVISDTKNGSIGFRNHSVPDGMTYGGEWEEDILFFEPDVSCVNTNITLFEKIVEQRDSGRYVPPPSGIVDRGGFVNINRTQPYDVKVPNFSLYGGQSDPLLYEKAYLVAWATNLYNMQYLNVTQPLGSANRSWVSEISSINSTLGKQYFLNTSAMPGNFMTISRTFTLPSILNPPSLSYLHNSSYETNPEIANPWNVTSGVYYDAIRWVGGRGDGPLSINQLDTVVGLVTGTGKAVDGPPGATQKTINSTWEAPTYVCVGATKALIKTVKFNYNTTSSGNTLPGVRIIDIKPKEYDNPSSVPIWAMENPGPEWNISMINPIWGIVDSKTAENSNISTTTSERFYMPASASSNQTWDVSDFDGDYLPAIRAGPLLWKSIFYEAETGGSYSGIGNLEMSLRWQKLSNSSTGIETMLRLIWTDFATNLLVGTKGIHNDRYRQPTHKAKRDTSFATSSSHPVHVYSRRIKYDWPYAIPGLVCVAIVGASCALAFFSLLSGYGTVARLRYLLWNVSPGRVFARFMYPDETDNIRLASTKRWIRTVGYREVRIHEQDIDRSSIYSGLGEAGTSKTSYIRVKEKEEMED